MLIVNDNPHIYMAFLDQQYQAMALALDIANPQTPILNTLHDVLASPAKTEWLTEVQV